MVIKRVGPVSCARIAGMLYAIIGLLAGVIFSLVAMAGGFAFSGTAAHTALGAVMGVGAIVIFPIFYGATGFLGALLAAWLYNILAGLVGGIQLHLE
ncbi:MAG TPA: hypothetical protein VF283_08495 [Bryobacteraceae bacterium]